MAKQQRVLIAGCFKFPRGSAASSRIRMFSRALQLSGVKVLVATNSALYDKNNERTFKRLCSFERIPFISLNRRYTDPVQRLLPRKIIDYVAATLKLWCVAFQLSRDKRICAILLYGRSFVSFSPLFLVAKLYKVRLVYDAVEWFPASSFRGGYLSPAFWDSRLGSMLPLLGFNGVSCITENLATKYKNKILDTYIIPSLFDFQSLVRVNPALTLNGPNIKHSIDEPFIVTYAGTLKEGEDFETLLRAIEILLNQGINLRLNVLGVNGQHQRVNQYWPLINQNPRMAESITFLGRVPDEDYLNCLQQSNCLILPRADTPTTRAAFPTRLPEFLYTGVPVVTSQVPDVDLYLENRIDAELVKPGDPYDLASAFYRLYEDPSYASAIAKNGYEKALRSFDYRTYAAVVKRLVLGARN